MYWSNYINVLALLKVICKACIDIQLMRKALYTLQMSYIDTRMFLAARSL